MSKKDTKGFFNLNGHRYKVFFEDLEEYKDDDAAKDDILFGIANHVHMLVGINNMAAKSKQEESMTHEIIHCILTPSGFSQNEKLVRVLAAGLNQLGVGKFLVRNVKKAGRK